MNASPEDVKNEVEDFPVMWAAPVAMARGLPRQLDRDRRPAAYCTTALVTDQRIVVIGDPDGRRNKSELLWECERSNIAAVERKAYSRDASDTVLRFTDDSQFRLHLRSGAWFRYLVVEYEFTDLDVLTLGQRRIVDPLLVKHGFGHPPVITRHPSGNSLVELLPPDAFPPSGQPVSVTHLMRFDGLDAPSSPDDF
ncbi:hypothetical protein ACYF6T_38115 [Streptomyces sp. 7R007]